VREYGGKIEEKLVTVQINDMPALALTPDLYHPVVDISLTDTDKLKRKIKFRFLPWLTLLHILIVSPNAVLSCFFAISSTWPRRKSQKYILFPFFFDEDCSSLFVRGHTIFFTLRELCWKF
jgi:hypothetical protein